MHVEPNHLLILKFIAISLNLIIPDISSLWDFLTYGILYLLLTLIFPSQQSLFSKKFPSGTCSNWRVIPITMHVPFTLLVHALNVPTFCYVHGRETRGRALLTLNAQFRRETRGGIWRYYFDSI